MGRRALAACEQARELVSNLVGCNSSEIVFTSGATESNNMVLAGVASQALQRRRVVTTAVEHKSIIEPCRSLAEASFEVIRLPVNSDGVVDLSAAASAIDDSTAIVTIQGANNEVGTLQPIKEIACLARSAGTLFHCDGAQILGKVSVSHRDAQFDYASFSGHKVYGPKGVGILFVRKGAPVAPLLRGGGQEGALRSGTLNVPGIIGLGEACRVARYSLLQDMEQIGGVRCRFEAEIIRAFPTARINASLAKRLPGTTSLTIPGVPATMLMANVPHLCIAEGSACSSGAPEPSHVLLAMGISRDDAECTVRISFGRNNSISDADEAARSIARAAEQLKSMICDSAIPGIPRVERQYCESARQKR
jgi:cysteine desulfurase